MQLRYVASELGTGLKRNVSMTIAVILTIFISLTLVGVGLLMRSQVGIIEERIGSQLEVKIVFCGKNSPGAACVEGVATKEQEQQVEDTLESSDYVSSYRYESREQAYENFQAQYADSDSEQAKSFNALDLTVDDMSTGYWATLADPDDNDELLSQVQNLPGVANVIDLREKLAPVFDVMNLLQWVALGGAAALVLAAVLQVSNTIRLAAMARRREIGIMRLVGASSLYIQLPFVLEILFSALVGAALACGSIALAMATAVPWLRDHASLWPWVTWGDARVAMYAVVVIALLLAVVPTLLMTRKYLKV
jgi:cell division transport system permease protein